MDERRPDHFAHLKQAPEAPPPEADKPIVRPDLVEFLEAQFPPLAPKLSYTQDDLVADAQQRACCVGEQRVIAAIRELIRGA